MNSTEACSKLGTDDKFLLAPVAFSLFVFFEKNQTAGAVILAGVHRQKLGSFL
jgi:hypothetical protein